MAGPRDGGLGDEDVVREVLDGAKDRYKLLIERYQDRVLALVRRFVSEDEAQDIAQEAFLRAYLHLDQFDPALKFSNWILKIAQNQTFSQLRKKGVRQERLALDGELQEALGDVADARPSGDPAAVAIARTDAAVVERAMARLPEKYRLLLHLRHAENRQYQEIAQILALPLGTVKFRLHVAYKTLREALDALGAAGGRTS